MAAHALVGGLHVYMFGSPRLVFDGRPVALKAPPRTLPLFLSLLLEETPAADARGRIAGRLWPEASALEARKNLRRHLSYLRAALQKIGVESPDLAELRVSRNVVPWTDVSAFTELAVSATGAEAATDLYTGPLLSTFEDEDWLVEHRLRLQREYVRLVLRSIDRDWSEGRSAEALARAERACAVEPLVEEFVQSALRLSIELGDGSVGLALFDRYAVRLRSEYDSEPSNETTALVDRLKHRSPFVALPAAVDAFVGRTSDLTRLSAHLATRACIALYGPPGIGKSRLAAALAAAEAPRFLDGVWWIDAGTVDDGSSLEARALRTVGPRAGNATSLANVLAGKSALLVFDACEEIGEEVARLARSLVRSGGVRIVTTSTHRIPLSEALEWSVEPLRSADAVTLFEDRATAVAPRAAFGATERAFAASICAALDGIPLAIELAARRTKAHSLAAILQHANESVDEVLAGSIARSVSALDPADRDVFLAAAAFATEFRAETVAGVCGIGEPAAVRRLERIESLSLIAVSVIDGEPRYEMLQTIRTFALASLDEGRRGALRAAHARYFTDRIVALDERLRGAFAFESYAAVEIDYPNVVAALEWSIADTASIESAARTCLALSRFWYDRGYLADGLRLTSMTIERMPKTDATRLLNAELAWIVAWLRRNNGDYHQAFRESLASLEGLVAAHASPRRLAFCELLVANAARMIGDHDDALRRARSALVVFDDLGERYYAGYARLLCGITHLTAGDVDAAREELVQALHLYEEAGARADAALALLNLVECAFAKNELELAEMLANESAERCIEVGNLYFLAYANHALARVLLVRREWSAAVRTLMTVARSARDFGDRELVALAAEAVADLAHAAARYTTAAILIGAADAERDRAGAPRPIVYRAPHERLRTAIHSRMGDDAATHAESVGAALAGGDLPIRIEGALRDAARVFATRGANERPRVR